MLTTEPSLAEFCYPEGLMQRRLFLLFPLMLISACSTLPPNEGSKDFLVSTEADLSPEVLNEWIQTTDLAKQEVDAEPALDPETESAEGGSEINDSERASLQALLQKYRKERPRIPIAMNAHVQKWIRYFAVQDRERFQRFLSRGEFYRPVVEQILAENQVPRELYFLGLIESGYVVQAMSHARAVGIWQFMRSTGRSYGLDSTPYVDERRDPIRATEAAARHLKDLRARLGTWYLAMAAYNAGEGRIRGAIRRGGSLDFWDLRQRNVLPEETEDYVPKFLAAVIIGQHPEKFGFQLEKKNTFPNVQAVSVPSPVSLGKVAHVLSVPVDELRWLNPHLTRSMTPPHVTSYDLWIPEQKAELLRAEADALERTSIAERQESRVAVRSRRSPSRRSSNRRVLASAATSSVKPRQVHVVRRGERLEVVARKYRISKKYLKRINNLQSDRLRPGMRLRLSARAFQHV